MTRTSIRPAIPGDAAAVARLHADSWRRFYRGVYSDAYLDGDVDADRLAVWTERLGAGSGVGAGAGVGGDGSGSGSGGGTLTLIAEVDRAAVGFVHVVFGEYEYWESFIDNLHVAAGHQRSGIGRALLVGAARAVDQRANVFEYDAQSDGVLDWEHTRAMYLWVLEQNTDAQAFYQAMGGEIVGRATVSPPGGVPERLVGEPVKLRCEWRDASVLLR